MSTEREDDAEDAAAVSFALHAGPGGMLWEHDPAFADGLAQGLSLEDLAGEFRISLGDGAAPVIVADDIVNLAWGLGIDAIAPLRSGQPHEFEFAETNGGVRLEPVGDQTRLILRGVALGQLPTAALARHLLACAGRLAAGLGRLGRGDPQVQAVADALQDGVVGAEMPPSDQG